MSITNLTSPYSTPYQVSADDIDLIKIRSLETSPLTHEDLDDNFANLMNKVNALVDIIGGSSAAISVDGDGNVGIGTANPSHTLEVRSPAANETASILIAEGDGDTGGFKLTTNTSSTYRTTLTHDDVGLVFNTSPVRPYCFMDGNVGIGTTSPNSSLHVKGAGIGSVIMLESDDDGSAYAPDLVLFRNSETPAVNDNIGEIKFRGRNDNETSVDYTMIRSRIVNPANGAENGELTFWTNKNNTLEQRMTIDTDGNVGIGTTEPDEDLHIEGSDGLVAAKIENTTSGDSALKLENTVGQFVISNQNGCLNTLDNTSGTPNSRMIIDPSGNVGIGTTNPANKLEIAGNVRINGGEDTGSQLVQWCDNNGHANIAAFDIFFKTGQNQSRTDSMLINSDGNVGIGTTSPSNALEVQAGEQGVALFKSKSSATDAVSFISIESPRATSNGRTRVGADGDDLFFNTSNGESEPNSSVERMRIDTNGNVGIGITSPQSNLHLASALPTIRLEDTDIANGESYSEINSSSHGGLMIDLDPDNNRSTTDLRINIDGSEKFRIDSDGNVGIGTTSPESVLEVQGKQAFADSASDLATSTTKSALRVKGSNNGSNSLWMGVETNNASPYIQGANGAGNTAIPVLINPFDGNVGIGTTDPISKLHIGSNELADKTEIRIENMGGYSLLGLARENDDIIAGSKNADLVINNTTATDIILGTDDSERMRIDSNGNVGIGTKSTQRRLIVDGGLVDISALFKSRDSGSYISLMDNSTTDDTQVLVGAVGNELALQSSSTERMRIDSDGNVGIGTPNPDGLLHLKGDTNSNGAELFLQVNNNNITDNIGTIHFGNNGDSKLSQILSGTSGANNSSYLTLSTSKEGTIVEHMRIDSGGNVGIGTTSPDALLHLEHSQGSAVDGFYALKLKSPDPAILLSDSTNTGDMSIMWQAAATSSGISGKGGLRFYRDGDVDDVDFMIGVDGKVGIGTTNPNATLQVVGSLSKSSGSFRIDHPVKPETHDLVHSFVEAPQADNIYRGKVDLVAGKAEVNIDSVAGMTEGTFVLLNREIQVFTSNESDWDAVRGRVEGNKVIIECQNTQSTATISWLVIGERQDKHMYDTEWTDENGKVIVEPLKPEPAPEPKVETESEEVITEEPVAEEAPVEEPQVGSEPDLITKEDGKEYIRIGDKDYEVLGKNEDGSLLLDDDVTNNG